jgi:putative hydrolase of the HAD superfamily
MVTNGAASAQRAKLAAVGLADRFDPLVISSEAGVKKPDPAIFEIALRAAGAVAADTWFVGDNLRHDISGAMEVGIHAVWLDRVGLPLQPDQPQPDAVLGSLDALLPSRGSAEIG